MAKGNFTRGPNRKGHSYKPGHPPYYTGGAKPGHAPTSDGSQLLKGAPEQYLFGQPLGDYNRRKNGSGNRPKDKERQCMEAIQNGTDPTALEARFPTGMIRRLQALQETASDPTHRDFVQANRLVREILTRLRGDREVDGHSPDHGSHSIQVTFGRVDVPMPGTPGAPVEEDGPAGGVTSAEPSEGASGDGVVAEATPDGCPSEDRRPDGAPS